MSRSIIINFDVDMTSIDGNIVQCFSSEHILDETWVFYENDMIQKCYFKQVMNTLLNISFIFLFYHAKVKYYVSWEGFLQLNF